MAAGNEGDGKGVMTLLLGQWGDQILITEEVLKAAAGNSESGKEVMTLLLDSRGDQISVTEEVVKAAAENYVSGKEVMTLLFDRRGDQIPVTEDVVRTVAGRLNGQVMKLLFDQWGDQIPVTEEIVRAAAGNHGSSKEVMTLLIDWWGDQISVTEEVVKAAAGNYGSGKEVMTLLFDWRGDQIPVTEEIVKAAAGNEGVGREVMALLFDQRREVTTALITEEIFMAAATCGQIPVLDLLSQQTGLISVQEEWRYIAKLYNAAKAGSIGSIEQLIHKGTKPDMRNIRGETPLWIAAMYGHHAVVKALAQRTDVNVNSTSITGRSPLFRPSEKGDEWAVSILMEAGADPNLVDESGDTAAIVARKNGHERIVKILEHWGQNKPP